MAVRVLTRPAPATLRPVLWGAAASVALLVVYLGIVGAASRSPSHVRELLATDWPFVVALSLGFGERRRLPQQPPGGAGLTGPRALS